MMFLTAYHPRSCFETLSIDNAEYGRLTCHCSKDAVVHPGILNIKRHHHVSRIGQGQDAPILGFTLKTYLDTADDTLNICHTRCLHTKDVR